MLVREWIACTSGAFALTVITPLQERAESENKMAINSNKTQIEKRFISLRLAFSFRPILSSWQIVSFSDSFDL
jgi:hypothetical protein